MKTILGILTITILAFTSPANAAVPLGGSPQISNLLNEDHVIVTLEDGSANRPIRQITVDNLRRKLLTDANSTNGAIHSANGFQATNTTSIIETTPTGLRVGKLVRFNSGFNVNAAGWVPSNGVPTMATNGFSGNCLLITQNHATLSKSYLSNGLAVTPYALYTLSGYVKAGTATNAVILVGTNLLGADKVNGAITATDNWQRFTYNFIPDTNVVQLTLGFTGGATNDTMYFDDLEVFTGNYLTQVGFASYTSNSLAPLLITIGDSPFLWTNTFTVNGYVMLSGGEIQGIGINDGLAIAAISNAAVTVPVQPGDRLLITNTVAPIMSWKPF